GRRAAPLGARPAGGRPRRTPQRGQAASRPEAIECGSDAGRPARDPRFRHCGGYGGRRGPPPHRGGWHLGDRGIHVARARARRSERGERLVRDGLHVVRGAHRPAAIRGSGGGVLTSVRGPSGIGKTALVRRFVEQLAADDRAVVLSGRCYVRESMPYKGLDSVIDSLTRFLRTLADRDLDRLITRDLATV